MKLILEFPFEVEQVAPQTLEVQLGTKGLVLPEIIILDPGKLAKDHNLTPTDMDDIHEAANNAAIQLFVTRVVKARFFDPTK